MLLTHYLHSFYNSMWLVANDIIIGVAIGSYLRNNSEYMAKLIVNDYLGVSIKVDANSNEMEATLLH